MRNRKGFTLMELLLVVAVLAIVAAAAAPTFFGGATEAMNEAKKAAFLSAYTNTSSGAAMKLAIDSSKGITPIAGIIDLTNTVPPAARQFKNGTDAVVTLQAIVGNVSNGEVIVQTQAPVNVNADMKWSEISPLVGGVGE